MGQFLFLPMPFRLRNVPMTFQSVMDSLVETEIRKELLVYLEDIIIFAETSEDLLGALERTRQILI